jgi:hypothetical protein
VLDPKRPIREADMPPHMSAYPALWIGGSAVASGWKVPQQAVRLTRNLPEKT